MDRPPVIEKPSNIYDSDDYKKPLSQESRNAYELIAYEKERIVKLICKYAKINMHDTNTRKRIRFDNVLNEINKTNIYLDNELTASIYLEKGSKNEKFKFYQVTEIFNKSISLIDDEDKTKPKEKLDEN